MDESIQRSYSGLNRLIVFHVTSESPRNCRLPVAERCLHHKAMR